MSFCPLKCVACVSSEQFIGWGEGSARQKRVCSYRGSLFCCSISTSDHMALHGKIIDALERIGKETVVAYPCVIVVTGVLAGSRIWHNILEINSHFEFCQLSAVYNRGYTQKNGAVSKVNKKFISHLTGAQRTPSAAAHVQVSHALPAVRFSCVLRGRAAARPVSKMASR